MSGLGLLASVVGGGANAGAASARQIADDNRTAEANEQERQYQTGRDNTQHQRQVERDNTTYDRQKAQDDLAHKRSLQIARINQLAKQNKPASNQWELVKTKDLEGNETVTGRFNKSTGEIDRLGDDGNSKPPPLTTLSGLSDPESSETSRSTLSGGLSSLKDKLSARQQEKTQNACTQP